jgi:1-acyl-sn-glycerol-3-phosphate acyltransferase
LIIFGDMKWWRFVFGNLWKIYVGAIFCLTAILLYPFFLSVLAMRDGKTKSFHLFLLWSRIFQVLCLYSIKNIGEIPDLKKPVIIIANHTSYLDIFLMFAHFPERPFLFMGKSEILNYPILKTYFKNLNIPVDRKNRYKAAGSFLKAKQVLEDGFSLIIFPEGGIPELAPPKMSNFKDGAFKLSQQTGCPLIPVAFLNHYTLFSDPAEPFGPAHPGLSKAKIFDPVYVGQDLSACRKAVHMTIQEELFKSS